MRTGLEIEARILCLCKSPQSQNALVLHVPGNTWQIKGHLAWLVEHGFLDRSFVMGRRRFMNLYGLTNLGVTFLERLNNVLEVYHGDPWLAFAASKTGAKR